MNHYFLACSISATVRQSVQIAFDDLKLPDQTIKTLKEKNTVSIRPNLSNALKGKLDELRALQRELYDECTIHFGDAHFVTENYFYKAHEFIKDIKYASDTANAELRTLWDQEYAAWQETAENILRPLFSDEQEYDLAFQAYMKVFPTKAAYHAPIRVSVVGPLPVVLEVADEPVQGDIKSLLAYENNINTAQVLEAAKASAADRALTMSAELLDDLDARTISKVGKQQTGSDKKRGSWEITAGKLKLISDSVPGFEQLSVLATRLLDCGRLLTSPDKSAGRQAHQEFQIIQSAIRQELENICNSRDESKGLEKLKQSLALSSKYKTLCERIKTAENSSHLNLLVADANVEIDVYEQRAKNLRRLIERRKELISAANENLDELISDVNQPNPESIPCDF
jgi:hypothetical protein